MIPEDFNAAQGTAERFLKEHASQIAATLSAQTAFIDILVARLTDPASDLDRRLDCLARISEIARLIQEDSDGFFHLASRPVVARVLAQIPLAD